MKQPQVQYLPLPSLSSMLMWRVIDWLLFWLSNRKVFRACLTIHLPLELPSLNFV